MSDLFPQIQEEVAHRTEEVRCELNALVHRRRFLRHYVRTLEDSSNSPENYDQVVLEQYRRELQCAETEVPKVRARLAAWRHAEKLLETEPPD